MKIRSNLGNLLLTNNKPVFVTPSKIKVGRVFGVITTENTPTKKQFEKCGGFNAIGAVFYRDYSKSYNIKGENSDEFFDQCSIAFPISSDIPYPLVDELVIINDLPSAFYQENPNSSKNYYTEIVNVWNNPQVNSQPSTDEYNFKTFKASENVKNLLRFEGDKIIQGRKGNSIRFGSTVKDKSNLNEWSVGPGEDGDPITIISNGQNADINSLYHVEKINEDYSSIYITSTQSIPLNTSKYINPLTNPTKVSNYYEPQVIINGNRVVINSKKDDILISATTNIELNTERIVNLNAKERIHLNSPKIFLGSENNGLPTEPLILGDQFIEYLTDLLGNLSSFCSALKSAKSTAEGSDLTQIQTAATELNSYLIDTALNPETIDKLLSKKSRTA